MNNKPTGIQKIVMGAISAITPSCKIITHKISESMDHPISSYEKIQIRLHILGCKFCARYRKQLILVHSLLENMSETALKEEQLPAEVKADIKRTIREHLPK